VSDIYAAPQAELRESPRPGSWGSVERGVAGDYELSIRSILREAWDKTNGAKLPINGALVIYALVFVPVLAIPFIVLNGGDPSTPLPISGQIAQQLLSALVGAPLAAGLFIIGLRRAVDLPIRASMVLSQFHKIVPLFVAQLLFSLLMIVGFLFLILPGIYLAVGYQLGSGLVVDKNLGPWKALEASRKAIGKHWFRSFGLVLALVLINMLTVLTLFIGLIWSVPMSLIAFGVYYRTIFGFQSESSQGGVVSARG